MRIKCFAVLGMICILALIAQAQIDQVKVPGAWPNEIKELANVQVSNVVWLDSSDEDDDTDFASSKSASSCCSADASISSTIGHVTKVFAGMRSRDLTPKYNSKTEETEIVLGENSAVAPKSKNRLKKLQQAQRRSEEKEKFERHLRYIGLVDRSFDRKAQYTNAQLAAFALNLANGNMIRSILSRIPQNELDAMKGEVRVALDLLNREVGTDKSDIVVDEWSNIRGVRHLWGIELMWPRFVEGARLVIRKPLSNAEKFKLCTELVNSCQTAAMGTAIFELAMRELTLDQRKALFMHLCTNTKASLWFEDPVLLFNFVSEQSLELYYKSGDSVGAAKALGSAVGSAASLGNYLFSITAVPLVSTASGGALSHADVLEKTGSWVRARAANFDKSEWLAMFECINPDKVPVVADSVDLSHLKEHYEALLVLFEEVATHADGSLFAVEYLERCNRALEKVYGELRGANPRSASNHVVTYLRPSYLIMPKLIEMNRRDDWALRSIIKAADAPMVGTLLACAIRMRSYNTVQTLVADFSDLLDNVQRSRLVLDLFIGRVKMITPPDEKTGEAGKFLFPREGAKDAKSAKAELQVWRKLLRDALVLSKRWQPDSYLIEILMEQMMSSVSLEVHGTKHRLWTLSDFKDVFQRLYDAKATPETTVVPLFWPQHTTAWKELVVVN